MSAASSLRTVMVTNQIAACGVFGSHALEAMRGGPRERFIPELLRKFAYAASAPGAARKEQES